MGMFTRSRRAWTTDPAELAQWRGRAVAIDDVGVLPVDVVFEALKTEPELADDSPLYGELDWPAIMMVPLGLQMIRRPYYDGDDGEGQANYFGARLGRPVLLRHGAQDTGGKAAFVTWVGAVTEPMSLAATKGQLVPDDPVSAGVSAVLSALAPAPDVWKHAHLVGGPEGLVVKRPITMTGSSAWVYDLWLAERLADAVGVGTRPYADPNHFQVPYGLDRARRW